MYLGFGEFWGARIVKLLWLGLGGFGIICNEAGVEVSTALYGLGCRVQGLGFLLGGV